jgi:plasmid maintenance system antidote protein VapI
MLANEVVMTVRESAISSGVWIGRSPTTLSTSSVNGTESAMATSQLRSPSAALVIEIIKRKRGITPDTTAGLGSAFGTSAGYWLNLQMAYQAFRADGYDSSVAQRAQIYTKAPVCDMIRRG